MKCTTVKKNCDKKQDAKNFRDANCNQQPDFQIIKIGNASGTEL